MQKTSASDVRSLVFPNQLSHKRENGVLLVLAGSGKYHGAAMLALRAAPRFTDLVFFSSTKENERIAREKIDDVIIIPRKQALANLKDFDCVLVGPGMGTGNGARKITNAVLKSGVKCVLDADALKALDKRLLHPNAILTPHSREFELVFGEKAGAKSVQSMAKKYGCVILLKHPKADIISNGNEMKLNFTGNAGMTKGGTGDVLAGMCAALACKNALFRAACAAAYLNGLAGDMLLKKYSFAYAASDLVEALQLAYKSSTRR